MTEFGIAACQTAWPAGNNLERMRADVEQITVRYPWVEMIVFPELTPLGPCRSAAIELPGPDEDSMCRVARDHRVWLLPGSVYERSSEGVFNTTPVIDPSGQVIGRYRKVYPFCPYESEISSGKDFLVFDVPGVARFGVLICYDIWIPEVLRSLAWLGAEILIHPVLTNTIERDVELAMVRAGAAQNQCYLFNVNSAGGGQMGCGRSLIVGPDGDVIYEAQSGPEVMAVPVDVTRVTRSRERGLLGLGQPLKSFRDVAVNFPVYETGCRTKGAFGRLGPLTMPGRRR